MECLFTDARLCLSHLLARTVSALSVSCSRMANRSSQGQGLGSLLLAEGSKRLREQADFCPREEESSPLFFGPCRAEM